MKNVIVVVALLVMCACDDPGAQPIAFPEGVKETGSEIRSNGPDMTGAATAEELARAYCDAHMKQDVTLLHRLLLWRSARGAGMMGAKQQEDDLQRLFKLKLEAIEYVALEWNYSPNVPRNTGAEYYVPVGRGGSRVSRSRAMAGVFDGKLLLHGKLTLASGDTTRIVADPALFVRPLNGRMYLYSGAEICADVGAAVSEGRFPQFEAASLGDLPEESKFLPVRTRKWRWRIAQGSDGAVIISE